MTLKLDRHETHQLVVGIEPDSSNLNRTINMESIKIESKMKLFIPFKGDIHDERKGNKDSTRKDIKEPYPKTVDILNNFARKGINLKSCAQLNPGRKIT
jgi:hypothetical protein